MALVQSDSNCPDLSDWLKRATSGSKSQGAPSFNSLPGMQSGPQALEGSMELRALSTSSSLNNMSSIYSVLLPGTDSLRKRQSMDRDRRMENGNGERNRERNIGQVQVKD